jgi:hypothetical protein
MFSVLVPAAAVDDDDCEVIVTSAAANDVPIGHESGTVPTAVLLGLGLTPAASINLFISACTLTAGGLSSSGSSAEGMPANGSGTDLLGMAAAVDCEVIAPAELDAAVEDCEVIGPAELELPGMLALLRAISPSAASSAASQSDLHSWSSL